MSNLMVCENRIKNMLVIDKQINPDKVSRLIKSEVLYVLKNYIDVCAEDVDVDIFFNENGFYEFNINGVFKNIKTVKLFN